MSSYITLRRVKMTPLVLLILGVSGVFSESHSLKYYITVISNPVGFPAYSLKAYIDDMELASYNDKTYLFQSSLKGRVNADYWVDQTLDGHHFHLVHKLNVHHVNSVLNQTHGEYIYQLKFACTVDEDGNYGGYLEYARNGKEFIVFDKERILYIPMTFQAEMIIQTFNKNTFYGHTSKYRLEKWCPKLLNSFLKYANYELKKKVVPEVKVWGHQSNEVLKIQCLVYGFHPRVVDVKWVRNGVDHIPSDEMTPILPHPDGTYQIRVSVEVPTRDGDTYSCHVDHSSLEEPLTVQWKPNDDLPLGVIVGSCVSAIVAVAVVCGVCLYLKKKHGYRSTNTSDTDSSTEPSNPPRA